MRKVLAAFFILACIVPFVSGCGMAVTYRNPPEKAPPAESAKGHASLKIPPGHLPPPGSCRLWFPGTPPGHQPPPGNCEVLARDIPAGAWLLHRPVNEPRHVDVSVYDDRRPGVVVEIRIFEAATGVFVGIRGESARR